MTMTLIATARGAALATLLLLPASPALADTAPVSPEPPALPSEPALPGSGSEPPTTLPKAQERPGEAGGALDLKPLEQGRQPRPPAPPPATPDDTRPAKP